ncbi:MAG: RHS repeat domain-containing protein [Pyrinomonadaceae bacterium]
MRPVLLRDLILAPQRVPAVIDFHALYFIQDHLGTARGLVDASGAVISSLAYDSYGNVTSGTPLSRYTYTGRELDTDTQTGLIYYRARWYDPEQGRLISEDPAGIEAGVNLYAYVENDPVGSSDPFGLIRYPKSRLRWSRCRREDWAYCERECGPRGVKSCRVREIFKIPRIKGYLAEWAWIRLQPSCNCNEECDNKKVPEPIPVIVPKPNRNTGPKPVPIPFWVPRFFTIPIIMVDPCLVYPELCSGQRT